MAHWDSSRGAWRITADLRKQGRGRPTRLVKAPNTRQGERLAIAAEVELRQEQGARAVLPGGTTFGAAARRWQLRARSKRGPWAPSTRRTVAEALEGYLLPAFGERELAGITATEIEDVYARWAAVPLAPSNIRRKDGMMRKIYADAVRLGELRPDGNPMLKVDRGGGTAPERMHIPTPEQLRRIVAVVERSSPMGAAFIELAAATGARRGSVLALRWQDVDLEACTLRVERGVSLGEDNKAHIKGTKSNRNYRIRLAGRVLDALRDLRRRAAETALALGEGARFDDLYLFSSDGGVNHWSVQHPSKVFRLAARELGLSWPVEGAEDGGGMHLHDLRHFAATRMLQAAVPVRVVAERLGCTEANVHRTYSHWIPSLEDERAAEVMAAAIG